MDLFIYDLFWCLYLRKSQISIFLESRCRARNPRSQSFWDLIVQRVGRRLNCWKGAYFTLGRRITLIQTCSACYMYTSVLSLIGQAPVEKFFVGWGQQGNKDHLVDKNYVCCHPREEGYLGLANLLSKNLSSVGK